MSSLPAVSRLRVSVIGPAVLGNLIDSDTAPLGTPEGFEEALVEPPQGGALPLTHPWPADDRGRSPDVEFWLHWMGSDWTRFGAINAEFARKLRRGGVPLRHSGRLSLTSASLARPALEVHLHPWGATAIVTYDVVGDMDLASASAAAETTFGEEANVVVGDRFSASASVNDAPGKAVEGVRRTLLANDPDPEVTVRPYVVATIIEGNPGQIPTAFPPDRGPEHRALHTLARGPGVLSQLKEALLPLHSGSGYALEPERLHYQIRAGRAVWSAPELLAIPAKPLEQLSAVHRFGVLRIAQLASFVELLAYSQTGDDRDVVREAVKHACFQLEREYGPSAPENGFVAGQFLDLSEGAKLYKTIKGKELAYKDERPRLPGAR